MQGLNCYVYVKVVYIKKQPKYFSSTNNVRINCRSIPYNATNLPKKYPLVNLKRIYDVSMTFASKLIHWGPVHHCYEPVEALQRCIVLSESVGALKKQKIKNKLGET